MFICIGKLTLVQTEVEEKHRNTDMDDKIMVTHKHPFHFWKGQNSRGAKTELTCSLINLKDLKKPTKKANSVV